MDDKPFFVFSMDKIRRTDPTTLERFARANFSIDAIMAEAGRLKLESQIRIEIEREFANPLPEFVKLMATRVQSGKITSSIKEQFQPLLAQSIAVYVRDKVNERINSALAVANPAPEPIAEGTSDDAAEAAGIVTTEDEIGGFRIIQAIAARHLDPNRVVMRDSLSYCAVLLDDNNRKPIVRMHFNSPTTRYLGTFVGKTETRIG